MVAANFSKNLVVDSFGSIGDVRIFIDDDGAETEIIDEGRIAIVEWRYGGWSAIYMGDFEPATIQ